MLGMALGVLRAGAWVVRVRSRLGVIGVVVVEHPLDLQHLHLGLLDVGEHPVEDGPEEQEKESEAHEEVVQDRRDRERAVDLAAEEQDELAELVPEPEQAGDQDHEREEDRRPIMLADRATGRLDAGGGHVGCPREAGGRRG